MLKDDLKISQEYIKKEQAQKYYWMDFSSLKIFFKSLISQRTRHLFFKGERKW